MCVADIGVLYVEMLLPPCYFTSP